MKREKEKIGKKLMRMAFLLLCMVGILNSKPMIMEAEATGASGKDGNLNWSIDSNGCLTVTGTGDYEERTHNSTTGWLAYKDEIKSATVKITGITNTRYMFAGCSNLESVNLNGLDTSNVTDMSDMFLCCGGLKSLDVGGLGTSNVTSMSGMFYDCSGLTSLEVSGLDTSKVMDMSGMFAGCSSLTSLEVSGLDTSNVTRMSYMFAGCSGLTSLDVSDLDTI